MAAPRGSLPGLVAYFAALVGPYPRGRWLELRVIRDSEPALRRFVPARQPAAAAAAASVLARAGDVYAGALPRARRAGGRAAVPDGCTVWAELDDQAAAWRLAAFEPQPAIAIRSGTPGHLHAYWLLDRPLAAGGLERANRRLAHQLGGDGRCVDAARVLRPPGTLNHKRRPPRPVELVRFTSERIAPERLLDRLEPLSDPAAPPRPLRPNHGAGDPLLALAAPAYVEALSGSRPGRDGKLRCPFHQDRTPSLHAYPRPGQGWFCFGCGRGGSVYDFAAELWGLSTRGEQFVLLRARLRAELLGDRRPPAVAAS